VVLLINRVAVPLFLLIFEANVIKPGIYANFMTLAFGDEKAYEERYKKHFFKVNYSQFTNNEDENCSSGNR
jgi:hypothetical protein